ncbi:MAG: hypothetical protein ACE5J4_02225, partial [Candidatus Aenigmatarchaeota archaeon]
GFYYWKSYANDTQGAWNVSDTWNFTINKATSNTSLTIEPDSPITYGTQSNATCTDDNPEADSNLYRNESNANNENNTYLTLPAGIWNYTCNVTQTQNYTSATNSSIYEVNKADPTSSLHIAINGSESNQEYTYPYPTNTTGWSDLSDNQDLTFNLYKNDNFIVGGDPATEDILLGVGNYTYIYNTTGGQNYTRGNITRLLNITKNTTNPVKLYLNDLNQNVTITYGTQSNATGIALYSDSGELNLYRDEQNANSENNSLITLAAKPFGYAYKLNITGNENYSSNSSGVTYYLFINKAPTTIKLYLNGSEWTSDAEYTYPYPTNVNATVNVSSLTATLERNGTDYGNPEEILLGVGYYNYTGYFVENENYTGSSNTKFLNITPGPSESYLYLNDSRANKNYNTGDIANITAETNVTGTYIEIWTNYSDGNWKLWDNGNSPLYNITQLSVNGIWNWTANFTNENYTSSYESWYANVTTPPDTEPPQWSNNQSYTPSTYDSSILSEFNITWTDNYAVHKVLFESNISGSPDNYSMTNSYGGNIYNFTRVLPAGTYYWKSWANDTATPTNWNYSDTWYFTINKADPTSSLHIAINGSENNAEYVYETITNTTGWSTITGQTITYNLYRDSDLIGPGDPISDITRLGVSNYTYIYNTTGNQNYTSGGISRLLNITIKTISIYLALNGTEGNKSYTYPEAVNATGWKDSTVNNEGTVYLYRNGELKNSGSVAKELILLGNGTYNYSLTFSAINYSADPIVNDRFALINKGIPTLMLTTSPGWTNTYPTSTTTTCYATSINNEVSANLYRNDSNVNSTENDIPITLPAGIWNYTCNNTETGNYSINSTSNIMTINKANNPVYLHLNGTQGNRTYVYPEAVNATGTSTAGTVYLYRDDSYKGTNEQILLGNGTYEYKVNATGNENYLDNTSGVTYFAFINKGPTLTRLFLNNSQEDKKYFANEIANFTVTVNVSGKTVYLDTNISGWVEQSDTTPLMNYTNLTTEGVYNITGYFPEGENYSGSSQTYYATVRGPYLEMDLIEPTGTKLVREGESFFMNSLATCKGGNCGEINITPRYNLEVIGTSGTLYVNDSLITCNLIKDQSCYANWTVYTTTIGTWNIDVNASPLENDTEDFTLSVYRVVVERVPTPIGVLPSPLLDLEIVNLTPYVFAGDNLVYTIRLTNIGYNETSFDAVIHKRIIQDNRILIEDVITRSMKTEILITDSINVPEDFVPGRYFFELFVEYDNKKASALATFDVKKDCLILRDASFDLFRRKYTIISDDLKNVELGFDNICNIPLTNPTLYIDGSKLRLPTISSQGFEKIIDFDRFGLHNATITYTEGLSEIEFYLNRKFDITTALITIIILGLISLGIFLTRRYYGKLVLPRLMERRRIEIFKQNLKKEIIKRIKKKIKEGGLK